MIIDLPFLNSQISTWIALIGERRTCRKVSDQIKQLTLPKLIIASKALIFKSVLIKFFFDYY